MHITRATPADIGPVADLITRAFLDLPPSRWLVEDPGQREVLTRANFAAWTRHALEYGHVDMIGTEAAAVWFHRDRGPIPAPAGYDPPDRFRLMDETFAAHHPDDDLHHHLAFLAVNPDCQGRGLGRVLLRHHHAMLDEQHLAAFLEASSPSNVEFYTESGYQLIGEPYHLPGGGPPMFPMWRNRV